MPFVASVDKHPVYFDSYGNPLAFGRLTYCEQGAVAPKIPFQDYANTTPFPSNVLTLDAHGRTIGQVFLGVGAYTVYSQKFIGKNPSTDPDSMWANDDQWDEWGLAVPALEIVSVEVSSVATIAALRAFNPATANHVFALGYYVENDIFPREYFFDTTSSAADDGGITIASSVTSVGRWRLRIGCTDVLDSRIYGIIPNRTGDMTSAINNLSFVPSIEPLSPSTIYFAGGVYQVSGYGLISFSSSVKIDSEAQFQNLAAGTLVFSFGGAYDIARGFSFTDGYGSTGKVIPAFPRYTGGGNVDPAWWGVSPSGDSATAWASMLANLTQSYTVVIDKTCILGGFIVDQVMPQPIIFKGHSYVTLTTGAAHNLRLEHYGGITLDPSWTGSVFTGDLTRLNVQYPVIHSSWFSSFSDEKQSIDLSYVIRCISPFLTRQARFILDLPFNNFSTTLSASSTYQLNLFWETGLIQGNSLSTPVYFWATQIPQCGAISSDGFALLNQPTLLSWFVPNSPSNLDMRAAFSRASFCANCNAQQIGIGDLDLCGYTIPTVSTISLSGVSFVVHGGLLETSPSVPVFSANCGQIDFYDMDINAVEGSCLIDVYTGLIRMKNVSFTAPTGTTITNVIQSTSPSSIGTVDLCGCSFFADLLFPATTLIGSLNIHDCPLIRADLSIPACACMIHNNQIQGGHLGAWYTYARDPTIINGNRFSRCGLFLIDIGAKISGIIHGNKFSGIDGNPTPITLVAKTANTYLTALLIASNSVVGPYASKWIFITRQASGSGSWGNSQSFALITNNSISTPNILNPATRGFINSSILLVNPDPLPAYMVLELPDSADASVLDASMNIFYVSESTRPYIHHNSQAFVVDVSGVSKPSYKTSTALNPDYGHSCIQFAFDPSIDLLTDLSGVGQSVYINLYHYET